MIRALRVLFGCVFVFMVGVTVAASLKRSLWAGWPNIVAEPWALATLADAYCGFLTFYAWVFYKETSWASRLLWFVLIMSLGNIAMAYYMMALLFKLPSTAGAQDVLLRRAAA
jgi:hypothetical protein